MVELFSKWFVKDHEKTEDKTVRAAYGRMTAVVGIILNLFLVGVKMLAGLLSGSVSILADAVNNLSDAGSSLISFVCFKISAKPADRDHPYGHARIEYVTSMIVSMLILVIGVELLKTSIESLISPKPESGVSLLTVGILAVAILAKLWLGFFNLRVGKKIQSEVMRATATDSLSDALSTGAVLLGVGTQLLFPYWVLTPYVDGIMGSVVSVLILIAGFRILNDTKNSILGVAPAEAEKEAILSIVKKYPETLGVHDLIVHQYGPGNTIASLHVEVDGTRNMFDIHDAIDNMEQEIQKTLGVLCTIHTDPVAVDEDTTAIRQKVAEKMQEINPQFSIHDFRMVKGITHSNLIFDLTVPFECRMTAEEIRATAAEKVREIDKTFAVVLHIDRA